MSPSAWGGSGTHSNNCYYNVTNPPSETGGIIGNPLFVNYTNGDYHLQNSSPCINSGYNLGLPCDFEGTPVPQGPSPDKGAYEWMDNSGNNNPPQINAQTFSISENSPNGQQVGTVIATDPDAGQTLTYTILSGNTNNAFQIGSSTGVLTVNNSTALNYETTPTFTLVVKVQDNGTGSLSAQANITVNLTNVNESPQISNQTFSIAENTANGQQVGTVTASDPDNGQTLTYSILSGNTNNAFQIGSSTGTLTVNNSTALNYETTPVFTLVVKVQDNGSGSLFDQAPIIVNLTDVNEPPVINDQTFSISLTTSNLQEVGTIIAFDPDAGQLLKYTIISGNQTHAFKLNSNTGVLYVNKKMIPLYLNSFTFNLTVQVQDNGNGNLSSQAMITVKITGLGNVLSTTTKNLFVAITVPQGFNNTDIASFDIGSLEAHSILAESEYSYSISDGNENNIFEIDPVSGFLKLTDPSPLNFDALNQYTCMLNPLMMRAIL